MITNNSIKTRHLMCCVLMGLLLLQPSVYANDPISPKVATAALQDFTVTGMVSSETDGFPIPGATVKEKGTQNGAVTDFDGNFELTLSSQNAVLEFSYIGFKTQEIKVSGNQTISVVLAEDVQALDEVVVVGFGAKKKLNLTGSVSSVTSETFESRPVQNATQMLQGTIGGLNIASSGGSLESSPSENIRGVATIGDGSTGGLLVLIDGMEGDINSVNPQDIESVSVLKDAAASSIYGSRAPFGVILVTTKKGKSGKPTVSYS